MLCAMFKSDISSMLQIDFYLSSCFNCHFNKLYYLYILNIQLVYTFQFQRGQSISLRRKCHLLYLILFQCNYANQTNSSNFFIK